MMLFILKKEVPYMSEQQYKSVIGKYMSHYLSECQRKGHKAQDVKFVFATIDHKCPLKVVDGLYKFNI